MNNYYILLSQEKITDYGLHPIIAATSNWIVVVGYEEHQDLLIYDTFDKTLSMIQTGFQHADMRIATNDKILVTCLDPTEAFGDPFSTNIKIFDVKTKETLISENLNNFINFALDNYSQKSIIILKFKEKIEVLVFNDENLLLSRTQEIVNIEKIFLSNFVHPYLTYCEIVRENSMQENYQVFVWRFEENSNRIVCIFENDRIHNFVFQRNERRVEIYNIGYYSFFVFSIFFIQNGIGRKVSRLINRNGEKIRDINLDIFFQETIYLKFEDKLFIERESNNPEEGGMFQFFIDNIKIKENQSITEFDLYDLIQKDTHGYHDFVINKCFMGSIKLIKEGYDIHLSLKRLNYF